MNMEKHELIEPKDENRIIDESTYVNSCVDYALRCGWVKPAQKDMLIREYLLPIYRHYTQVLEEIKDEVAAAPDAEELRKTIIRRLGHILERTQRIGSTDFNNITRSIYEYRNRFCKEDTYLEYAVTSLADFIYDLFHSKKS